MVSFRRTRRPIVALSIYSLLASNRDSLFTVYFVLFLSAAKGATVPEALAILSLAYVGGSLLGPLAGRWSDKLGRRWPFLVAGEAGSLPLFLLVLLLPGYLAAGVAFIAAEVVLSLGSPALNAFVTDATGEGERGKGYGTLAAASALGAAIGFPIAGYLMGVYGLDALFLVVGGVMVAALAMVLMLLPDLRSPPSPPRKPITELGPLTVFSFAVSIRTLGWGAVLTFYGAYAYSLGASFFDISLIAITGFITAALVSVTLGKAVDRVGEIRALTVGAGVSLAAMVIYFLATAWTDLIPALIIYRVGFALMVPAMLSWVGRISPPGRRAEYMGFFSLVNSTLWSLGPVAGAFALEAWGPPGLFSFAVITTAVSAVLIPILYRSQVGGRPPSKTPETHDTGVERGVPRSGDSSA